MFVVFICMRTYSSAICQRCCKISGCAWRSKKIFHFLDFLDNRDRNVGTTRSFVHLPFRDIGKNSKQKISNDITKIWHENDPVANFETYSEIYWWISFRLFFFKQYLPPASKINRNELNGKIYFKILCVCGSLRLSHGVGNQKQFPIESDRSIHAFWFIGNSRSFENIRWHGKMQVFSVRHTQECWFVEEFFFRAGCNVRSAAAEREINVAA